MAAAAIMLAALATAKVRAADMDPLDTGRYVSAGPATSADRGLPAAMCALVTSPLGTLTLLNVTEIALCNNPQTRAAWINTRIAAAQLGISRASYLPSVSLSAVRQWNRSSGASLAGNGVSTTETNVALSLQYLLFDFGGRSAQVESDREALIAADLSQDAEIQSVLFSTIQDYYDLLATTESVNAARATLHSGQVAYAAAVAQHQAGTVTLSDVLQAQTALSQARFTLTQTLGTMRTARGTLANIMGLPADTRFAVATPAPPSPNSGMQATLKQLIAQAARARPDLAAARAEVQSAKAGVTVVKSSGLPALSAFATPQYVDSNVFGSQRQTVFGLSLSVPLFSGFSTTYQIHKARAELDSARTARDQLANQVSLQVFDAYTAYLTAREALAASGDLVASAQASAQLALGRYQAGAGNILDVLSANAALAAARSEDIQTRYDLYIAQASLAEAVGNLNLGNLG
ncbi:MAG: TolC family protein [Gammaproteobacteria bacterium]